MKNLPNIIHFVYPVTELTRPLSYLNYIAVRRALLIHRPDRVLFWTNLNKLTGHWGELIEPMVTLMPCEAISEYDGTPIRWPQYMSDVLRLQILQEYGGIYMDTDMLLQKPLYEWMGDKMVMSWEPSEPLGVSVCNALIISPADNNFIFMWLELMGHALKSDIWAEAGVNLPAELWKTVQGHHLAKHVEIVDPYFFCPLDLKQNWLFTPELKAEAKYKTKDSLAIHAFETFWRIQVSEVTPEWCSRNDCLFTDLASL